MGRMLGLAVQPPSRARPGITLYPPVAVKLSSETFTFGELSHKWAVVTLIKSSGEVLPDILSGKLADSAHPLPVDGHSSSSNHRQAKAYFYFPDLTIHEPGRYKIRISLMQMEYSSGSSWEGAAIVCEEVDSRSITVEDKAPAYAKPVDQERAFLRLLKADGQDVPSPPR